MQQRSDLALNALRDMSDDVLRDALMKLSGPLIKELAKRGYDVTLDAPAQLARDGHDVSEFYNFSVALAP